MCHNNNEAIHNDKRRSYFIYVKLHTNIKANIPTTTKMVEKIDCMYDDIDSSTNSSTITPMVNVEYIMDVVPDDDVTVPGEHVPLTASATTTSTRPPLTVIGKSDYVTFDDTKNKQDQDYNSESEHNRQENIQVAGIGSAVVGLIVGGPILAAIFGFGAAYAAERNAVVRQKFGHAWYKIKQWDRKHHIIECGVNTIGKGTVWIIEKISGKNHIDQNENSNSDNSIDSWVAAQQTPTATTVAARPTIH